MYQSNSYLNLLGSSEPYHARLVFGGNVIENEIVSVNVIQRLTTDDVFTFGGAISSFVEVAIEKSSFLIEGNVFTLYFSLGDSDWIPVGKYKARHPKIENGITKFEAYDTVYSNMNFGYFSDLSYPVDGKRVAEEISRKTGIPIVTTNLPNGVMVQQRVVIEDQTLDEEGNEITVTKYVNPFDGYMYNEALGYLAQLYGMTAIANRDGNIEFRGYKTVSYTINGDLYYDNMSVSETEFSVTKLSCATAGETVISVGSGEDSYAFENPLMTQERLNAIFNSIKSLKFYPSTIKVIGDARLDIGDIVNIIDGNGRTLSFPVMMVTHQYDGGIVTEVKSFGKSDAEATEGGSVISKGPVSQALDRQYAELLTVKDLIANKVSVQYIEATNARIDNLRADTIEANTIVSQKITAAEAEITKIKADTVEANGIITNRIEAVDGKIDNLVSDTIEANKITTERIDATEGKIDKLVSDSIETNQLVSNRLDAVEGNIQNLDSTYIRTETLIADSVTGTTGQFTKYLTGVRVVGDLIETNTLKADRLLLKGDDGLYYAINQSIGGLTTEQLSEEKYKNAISGTCLVAESVTATQIAADTLTTRELNVDEIFGSEAVIDKIRTNQILISTFKGSKGDSAYTWFKYSANANGNPCYDNWTTGRDYIGIYTGSLQSPPDSYTSYTWSRITGEKGNDGQNAVLYRLELDVASINKSQLENSFTPSSLDVSAVKVDGNTSYKFDGRFVFEYSTDGGETWNVYYTSDSNESNASYDIPTDVEGIDMIRVSIVDASGLSVSEVNNMMVSDVQIKNVSYFEHEGMSGIVFDRKVIPVVMNGSVGKGVFKVTPLYFASDSVVAPKAPETLVDSVSAGHSVWTTVTPEINKTYQFVYRCEQVEYSYGNPTWSTPVIDRTLTNMAKWCSASDTTFIDGGSIYAGSITADRLNAEDVFALNGTFLGEIVADEGRIGDLKISHGSIYGYDPEGDYADRFKISVTGISTKSYSKGTTLEIGDGQILFTKPRTDGMIGAEIVAYMDADYVSIYSDNFAYNHTHVTSGESIRFGVGGNGVDMGLYDVKGQNWIIYKNKTYNTVLIPSNFYVPSLCLASHSGFVGDVSNYNNSTGVNVASGGGTYALTMSLPPGTWVIVADANFPATTDTVSSNGSCQMYLEYSDSEIPGTRRRNIYNTVNSSAMKFGTTGIFKCTTTSNVRLYVYSTHARTKITSNARVVRIA